jgi:predicted phosphoadenosine phosphosulfate sulfurtransferase
VAKRPLGIDVLEAARGRIAWTFDSLARVYVSFSGGKDSTVMLHLVMEEAIRRRRTVGVLFVDLEGQYRLTIEHMQECMDRYEDYIEPFWVAVPLNLRNAVSQYEPEWCCWEPGREKDWIRKPPKVAITDPARFPFYRHRMEFEEFVNEFGAWYADGASCGCMVGIRSDESLNRFRTIARQDKKRLDGRAWTTWVRDGVFNVYPIYDWQTRDIWIYHARNPELPYNHLYDRMHQAGLSIHQQRICQPYGDDQRRGLWLFHVIEPETWAEVVARVNGANHGAQFAHTTGNMMGMVKITCPEGHTWESFARLLLDSMPAQTADHYKDKIAVFIHWWQEKYPNLYGDGIPDECERGLEMDRKVPSWRRICKALLRNDYWCKGLSFTHTMNPNYERYKKIMKKRRERWGII